MAAGFTTTSAQYRGVSPPIWAVWSVRSRVSKILASEPNACRSSKPLAAPRNARTGSARAALHLHLAAEPVDFRASAAYMAGS